MGFQRLPRASKVNLSKYVQVAPGEWRFCPVVMSAGGRPKQDLVLVNGIQEKHLEGAYYIDWYDAGKRRRQSVGKDPNVAFAEQQRQIHLLAAVSHGVDVVRPHESKQVLLSAACSEFLETIRLQRRPKTYKQYEVALRYFQECCGANARIGEISRRELLRFSSFLQNEKGLAARTSWTKFAVAVQLLNENGKSGLLKRNDWPS